MKLCFSKRLRQIPEIQRLCQQPVLSLWGALFSRASLNAVVGWGSGYRGAFSRRCARHTGIDYESIEEGFVAFPPRHQQAAVRAKRCPPYSLIVDKQGSFYDARRPSSLEEMLENMDLDDQQVARAKRVLQAFIRHRIGKYNDLPVKQPAFINQSQSRPIVLVVDQSRFDKSVPLAMAKARDFSFMLERAIAENPGAAIVVKMQPGLIGRLSGYLSIAVGQYPRVLLCQEPINAIHLLSFVDKVYTVSDLLGLEALMMDKEVHCFGLPFFAGWGLTIDKKTCLRRRRKLAQHELFYGVYLAYPTYVHPVTRDECQLEDVIDHIALQHHYHQKNRGTWLCVDMAFRNRMLNAYLQGHSGLTFRKSLPSAKEVESFDHVATWGRRSLSAAQQQRYGIVSVEDGFVRSINAGRFRLLGNSFSINFDPIGIYFDGQVPSLLEELLNTHEFSEEEKAVGQMAMEQCVSHAITKYNLTENALQDLTSVNAEKILVPGQVPDDASIAFGSSEVSSNLSLLEAVRAKHPDAYIIFKPHPDITKKQRVDPVPVEVYKENCDLYAVDVNILECISAVDAVHTMTSLSGFEALMRGKDVYVYGRPFYAGWGVTHDAVVIDRRRRKRSLIELVTAALVLYPRYFDHQSQSFTTAKHMMLKIRRLRESLN